jgi:hypothetical protein
MTSLLLTIHIVCAVATLLYGAVLSFGILFQHAERNEKKSAVFLIASLITITLGVALGISAGQETMALCSNITFYTVLLTLMHGVSLRSRSRDLLVIPGFSVAMVCLIILM